MLPAEMVCHHIGTFQLVGGRGLAVARIKGRVYVNFGAECRTDFTVAGAPNTLHLFLE